MQVEWMHTTNDNGDPRTIIQFLGIECVVDNHGDAEAFRMIVRPRATSIDSPSWTESDFAVVDEQTTTAFWGTAIIWASERTIAHLVHDVISNQ